MEDAKLEAKIEAQGDKAAAAIKEVAREILSAARPPGGRTRASDNQPITRVMEHPWTKLAIPIILAVVIGMGTYIAKGMTETLAETAKTVSNIDKSQAVMMNRLENIEDTVKEVKGRVSNLEKRPAQPGHFQ